jgi:hypothetical protein
LEGNEAPRSRLFLTAKLQPPARIDFWLDTEVRIPLRLSKLHREERALGRRGQYNHPTQVAKKQEPENQGAYQQTSEGETEQEEVTKLTGDRRNGIEVPELRSQEP